MSARFGPTLVRRMFLAMMFANAAILLGTIVRGVLDYQAHTNAVTSLMVKRASYRLEQYSNPQEAIAFALAWQQAFDNLIKREDGFPSLLEVWASNGRRLYFSQTQTNTPPLMGQAQTITPLLIYGEPYNLFRYDGAHWSLRAAFHVPSMFAVVKMKIAEPMFVKVLLPSFPILLLPLWFAIWRGFLPLRELAKRLTEREAANLSPLHFDAKYGELKPIALAIDTLLLRLQKKILREHAFVHDAAHELRTPIAVISAQTHVLVKAASPAEQAVAMVHINLAMARAEHLIRQLLELARVDAPCTPENHLHDMTQLLQDGLAQFMAAASARQITLEWAAPPHLQYHLERNTFLSILHNLLDNAIRYGYVGGTVLVTLQKDDTSLLLVVADNGPGITGAERELVFERFYRGTGHQASGSGLGLAIVRQAAMRLGANLALQAGLPHAPNAVAKLANQQPDQPNCGCQFTLLIPAQNHELPAPARQPFATGGVA